MSTARPTASSSSRPAGEWSAATTRRISSPTANICRCGRLLSAIGLSRLAPGELDFTPGPGPRTIDIGGEWGKVGFQLCYEMIFSGDVVDEKHRPGFIFNPVERRLVRPLGPAAASRPGAAPRGRGRPPDAALDADRDQRRDRCPRPCREVAAVAHRRRDRRHPSARRQCAAALRALRQCHPAAARLRARSSAALCLAAAAARGVI